jgi:translation initiation factor 2A
MPAKTTIFNQRAVATHSFPLGPRNTILFSPTGRFVLVAGFGNLAGQMDIYDLEKDYKKICTIEGGNPSVCAWSPDSRYILTATTSPRLRVDNGIRIWHVGGGIMYNEDMTELYDVSWRPAPPSQFPPGDVLTAVPIPHKSALAYLGTVKTPSKPAGAYRPPGARGTSTPLHFKREDEGGAAHVVSNGTGLVGLSGFGRGARRVVPGAEVVEAPATGAEAEENLSKAASKNKKKREARRAKDAEARAAGLAPGQGEQQRFEAQNRGGPEGRGPRQERSRSKGEQFRPVVQGQQQGRQGQRNGAGQGQGLSINAGAGARVEAPEVSVTSPSGGSPGAKKLRGLQKKIRAIEDLEMRLAGGERLEDTQMKKIGTKAAVQRELEGL